VVARLRPPFAAAPSATSRDGPRRTRGRRSPRSARDDAGVAQDLAAALAQEGLLLESAKGPLPNVAELVAGEPIRGSWWGHPRSHAIFDALNALASSPEVARMRLVGGKVTLVHRRLWPALLRVAERLPPDATRVLLEEHTATGAHHTTTVGLREWAPVEVAAEADALSEAEALALLPAVVRPA
jgi:hypothetical protein